MHSWKVGRHSRKAGRGCEVLLKSRESSVGPREVEKPSWKGREETEGPPMQRQHVPCRGCAN